MTGKVAILCSSTAISPPLCLNMILVMTIEAYVLHSYRGELSESAGTRLRSHFALILCQP